MIDGPLSGPKRQKLVGEGPRAPALARLAAPARRGRQTLPMPWPTGTALAQAPDRTSRRRTSAWIGFALPYRRLPEIGTKLVTWGAAMIKKKTMWIKAPAQGFPAMPVAPRRALPISRAGGRPKGGGRGRH